MATSRPLVLRVNRKQANEEQSERQLSLVFYHGGFYRDFLMRLHHIGKVVKDLAEAQKYYEETFGLKALGPPVIDPIQAVEVVFIETGLEGVRPSN